MSIARSGDWLTMPLVLCGWRKRGADLPEALAWKNKTGQVRFMTKGDDYRSNSSRNSTYESLFPSALSCTVVIALRGSIRRGRAIRDRLTTLTIVSAQQRSFALNWPVSQTHNFLLRYKVVHMADRQREAAVLISHKRNIKFDSSCHLCSR